MMTPRTHPFHFELSGGPLQITGAGMPSFILAAAKKTGRKNCSIGSPKKNCGPPAGTRSTCTVEMLTTAGFTQLGHFFARTPGD